MQRPWGRKGWVQDWREKEDHLEEGGSIYRRGSRAG